MGEVYSVIYICQCSRKSTQLQQFGRLKLATTEVITQKIHIIINQRRLKLTGVG